MSTVNEVAYQNYIGGRWLDSEAGETYTISNPADKQKVLGAFQRSVPQDAIKAIEACQRDWKLCGFDQRHGPGPLSGQRQGELHYARPYLDA